ncbi:hypothetical protein GX48_00875 [Paracoccidioides brasiliensis]|nr:hypothetical protein GX48_00875 [Paracoccidioides brasiliensis]
MSAPERGKRERRDVGIHASKTWKSQGSREQRRRRRPRYDGHGRTTERRGGFKKGQTDARPDSGGRNGRLGWVWLVPKPGASIGRGCLAYFPWRLPRDKLLESKPITAGGMTRSN